MPKSSLKEPAQPFTLRLTATERDVLERAAANMGLSVGEFMRLQSLGPHYVKRSLFRKPPVKGHQDLARLLTELGRLRVANNLSQIVNTFDTGALDLPPDCALVLKQAHSDISLIKRTLLQVLGKRRFVVNSPQLLAHLLERIRQMPIADHLNQQAKAVNVGNFTLTPETKTILQSACADIREIKNTLLQSLDR